MEHQQLQEVIDLCARKMRRLHEWAERTSTDKGAGRWQYNEGQFEAFHDVAIAALNTATAHNVALDTTRLDAALEIGDFL